MLGVRGNILAYRAFYLHNSTKQDQSSNDAVDGDDMQMSADLIEKVVTLYKTHCNILDQEERYPKTIVDLMKITSTHK